MPQCGDAEESPDEPPLYRMKSPSDSPVEKLVTPLISADGFTEESSFIPLTPDGMRPKTGSHVSGRWTLGTAFCASTGL